MVNAKVSQREWRAVLVYALALAIITTLPYVFAWSRQTESQRFSGFLLGIDDSNSYIGKMRLGARGEWNFNLFYTSEAHDSAALTFLPYIVPGQIIGLFFERTDPALTGALILTYHAMRIVFGVVMIAVMYRFTAEFIRSQRTRFLALILATLGGGFGWLLLLVGELPPEWYIPEGFSPLILYNLPHLALARATLLGGVLAVIHVLNNQGGGRFRLKRQLLAGVCWLVTGLAVPFYLTILYCVIGAWGLALWIRMRAFPMHLFRAGVLPVAMTLPLFAYYALVFTQNPVFAQWSAQNLLASPPPLHYVLAYGVLGVFAMIGGRWAWRAEQRDGKAKRMLLIGWVLIVPLLVYLPINVQRRMAEAVIVPLAILAAVGISLIARHLGRWWRIRLVIIGVILPSWVFLLLGSLLSGLQTTAPIYVPSGDITAMQWLNSRVNPGDVVLSSFDTGNILPAYADVRMFAGHGPETLFALRKEDDIARFYRGEITLVELQAIYSQTFTLLPIRYVFYGGSERILSENLYQPLESDALELVYSDGINLIYEVQR